MATSRFCAAGCFPGAAASTRALAAARAECGEAVGAGAGSLRFSGGEREEYALPAAVIATATGTPRLAEVAAAGTVREESAPPPSLRRAGDGACADMEFPVGTRPPLAAMCAQCTEATHRDEIWAATPAR